MEISIGSARCRTRSWSSSSPGCRSGTPSRRAASTARWRHLWKSVPKLVLDARAVGMREGQETGGQVDDEARATEFVRCVDSMLLARAAAGVEVLALMCPKLTGAHAGGVDHWWAALAESATRLTRFVLYTASKSAREAMGGRHVEQYTFPLHSLAAVGSRLRQLRLVNCGLEVSVSVSPPAMGPPAPFASLATTKLEFVSVTDMEVRRLLDLCVALTELVILCCHRISRLRVAHPQLRLLVVDRCKSLESMWIHAPALRKLRYTGQRIVVDCAHALLLAELEPGAPPGVQEQVPAGLPRRAPRAADAVPAVPIASRGIS